MTCQIDLTLRLQRIAFFVSFPRADLPTGLDDLFFRARPRQRLRCFRAPEPFETPAMTGIAKGSKPCYRRFTLRSLADRRLSASQRRILKFRIGKPFIFC